MLKIYNIKDKLEYLEEVCILTLKEWGTYDSNSFNQKIQNKKNKILSKLEDIDYCKLILLEDDELVGFISIFKNDGEDRCDLSPWYATMYVKKEKRGKGYSKILNNAILKEAKKRGFKKIYLKTDLVNYYEKFGFIYMEKLSNKEKLYYKDLI